MKNIICYLCEINKVFKEYKGTDLLDDEGNLPCFECYLEAEAAKEEEPNELR